MSALFCDIKMIKCHLYLCVISKTISPYSVHILYVSNKLPVDQNPQNTKFSFHLSDGHSVVSASLWQAVCSLHTVLQPYMELDLWSLVMVWGSPWTRREIGRQNLWWKILWEKQQYDFDRYCGVICAMLYYVAYRVMAIYWVYFLEVE